MVNFAFDYTGDGWDDILVVESRTPVLYVNPQGGVPQVDAIRGVHGAGHFRIDHVQGHQRRRQAGRDLRR